MEFNTLDLDFWRTLFDPDDQICVAKYLQGKTVRPVPTSEDSGYGWAQFFSVNALTAGTSRADANVAKHRSFLVEFDEKTRDEQWDQVEALQMPWSTCVYSGGKSLHFVVALAEPVDACTYRRLARGILSSIPKADAACKNPSRLSRYPGAVRQETGAVQELLAVRGRVALADLERWLASVPKSQLPPVHLAAVADGQTRRRLRNRTQGFLLHGAEQHRNQETFAAACDFAQCGYSLAEVVAKFLPLLPLLNSQKPEPFSELEMTSAIANAFRYHAQKGDTTSMPQPSDRLVG